MTEINITDRKTIAEIQEDFHGHFPFLKLEFYTAEHEMGQGSGKDAMLDPLKSIGEVRTVHNAGEVSIHGNQKVSTLETTFHDAYGLNVQVFRKSGELWLQTTTTDEWTLSEQNETAKELPTN